MALVTAGALAAPLASAAPRDDGATEVAAPDPVALFEAGASAFKEGKLELAIDKFEQSYALEPNPVLLYNMARAYEGLDRPEAALDHYRRYLEADPETADRGAVEARIAALDKEVARRQELERRRQPQPQHDPSPIPWVIAGAGVLGVGAGVVLGVLARDRESEGEAAPVAQDAADLEAEAQSLATGANVSWVIGGALLAGGVIWGAIDLTMASGSEPEVSLELQFRGAGLQLKGRF